MSGQNKTYAVHSLQYMPFPIVLFLYKFSKYRKILVDLPEIQCALNFLFADNTVLLLH